MAVQSNIRVVLFDLTGVLIEDGSARFWDILKMTPHDQMLFTDPVTDLVEQYECGKLLTTEIVEGLYELFNKKYPKHLIRSALRAMRGGPIAEMEGVIRSITAPCQKALLANTNPMHYQQALPATPALRLLMPHFLSFQIGALKPSPEIYHYVITHLACKPAELLLIDDSDVNIRGAQKCGMRGYRFRTWRKLAFKLRELRILRRR